MIDTEARVRATLAAVAAATALHRPESAYVETAPPRRFPVRSLGIAAAAAAVVGALVSSAPSERSGTTPASVPSSVVSQPAEGRLIAEGTVDGRRWSLSGVDSLPDTSESPCVVLGIEGRGRVSAGCGYDAAPSASHFLQLGAAAEQGDQVVLFGVLDAQVARVMVTVGDLPTVESKPGVDPARPDGARFFVYVAPRAAKAVRIQLVTTDGMQLESTSVNVDGPVGG